MRSWSVRSHIRVERGGQMTGMVSRAGRWEWRRMRRRRASEQDERDITFLLPPSLSSDGALKYRCEGILCFNICGHKCFDRRDDADRLALPNLRIWVK
jgi:hypothetical protein